MTVALSHAQVLTPDGWRDDLAVLIDGQRIAALLPLDDARLRTAEVHELAGLRLVPGFIDVQVNGGGGVLFNDAPDVDGLRRIAAAHRRFGTTGLLPTLISDDPAVLHQARDAVDAAIAAGVPGILGIHLEGPHLAPARKGVHDARYFHAPSEAELAALVASHSGACVTTLAPERVAPDAIRRLVNAGVIVSLGHSAADYDCARAALDAGARGFTHLFNAMTPLAHRAPGVVGAALDDPDSWCGLIADGHHVHPAAARVAIAAKARGKIMLVTDAMPPVGAADPSFVLNGETISARDGRCQTAAGVLAGSALDMASAVRHTVEQLGQPLAEAVRMASTYPADFLGLSASHGRIAPGCRADLVALDEVGQVRMTWIGGAAEAGA